MTKQEAFDRTERAIKEALCLTTPGAVDWQGLIAAATPHIPQDDFGRGFYYIEEDGL